MEVSGIVDSKRLDFSSSEHPQREGDGWAGAGGKATDEYLTLLGWSYLRLKRC